MLVFEPNPVFRTAFHNHLLIKSTWWQPLFGSSGGSPYLFPQLVADHYFLFRTNWDPTKNNNGGYPFDLRWRAQERHNYRDLPRVTSAVFVQFLRREYPPVDSYAPAITI